MLTPSLIFVIQAGSSSCHGSNIFFCCQMIRMHLICRQCLCICKIRDQCHIPVAAVQFIYDHFHLHGTGYLFLNGLLNCLDLLCGCSLLLRGQIAFQTPHNNMSYHVNLHSVRSCDRMRGNYFTLRYSSIPLAAALPAPIARITVAAPVTASPPA